MSSNFCTLAQARPTHVMHVTSYSYLDIYVKQPILLVRPAKFLLVVPEVHLLVILNHLKDQLLYVRAEGAHPDRSMRD